MTAPDLQKAHMLEARQDQSIDYAKKLGARLLAYQDKRRIAIVGDGPNGSGRVPK